MEQFSLEKYLENPSRKVVTKDGKPVRIVCTDLKNDHPIIAAIKGVNSELPYYYDINGKCLFYDSKDLFFADEEKTNKILDELKSYLKNTPKEQVEKDWKKIQDRYVQHFTNEKHDGKEKLTEFEKTMIQFSHERNSLIQFEHTTEEINAHLYLYSEKLLNLARKEIEQENSEFKPKFTYNEKDYSKLANKLIEFRNNTPLCSVSYRDGEGRKVILHYEKEILDLVRKEVEKEITKEVEQKAINHTYAYQNGYENGKYDALKDLPKWKKAKKDEELDCHVAIQQNDRVVLSDFVQKDEYYITLDVLKKLPKEE